MDTVRVKFSRRYLDRSRGAFMPGEGGAFPEDVAKHIEERGWGQIVRRSLDAPPLDKQIKDAPVKKRGRGRPRKADSWIPPRNS
jgi:hypothetical protein